MTDHDRATAIPHPCVLVVEDELLIAMALEGVLAGAGYGVVGLCPDVASALSLLRAREVDAALLDINLGGEKVFPVADALAVRGIPFVFLTGYGKTNLPDRHAGRPTVTKPYRPQELLAALRAVAGTAISPGRIGAGGNATGPDHELQRAGILPL